MTSRRHVFGPVPSRRLGRSLGVDLIPYKTCSFDCTYCQLGRTTNLTATRGEFVPTGQVIRELEETLKQSAPPDYITLSGSGEPTLHSGFGAVVDAVRKITDTPVAILTNSSLMTDPEVRRDCAKADLVVPSLDVADREMFACVNRPHGDVDFDEMVEGLVEFRAMFKGRMWLEILLLYGITGIPPYVRRILPLVERIRPDRVQINTAVRPPAESTVRPVPSEDLRELAALFTPPAEVIAHFRGAEEEHEFAAHREDILAMLRRRPCTLDDVVSGLGIHRNEAIKYLDELQRDGRIRSEPRGGAVYYAAPAA
ncbi:MAG: radical SAM protein [Candidatus Eisenbacteria sp.]|nr:radical SAM protein [Candidatus Eisenbacteria bacterium]